MTSFSMKIGIKELLIDIFWRIATQNLKFTFIAMEEVFWELARSFINWMILTRISLPFMIKYSTPFSVLTITLTKLKSECCKAGF